MENFMIDLYKNKFFKNLFLHHFILYIINLINNLIIYKIISLKN